MSAHRDYVYALYPIPRIKTKQQIINTVTYIGISQAYMRIVVDFLSVDDICSHFLYKAIQPCSARNDNAIVAYDLSFFYIDYFNRPPLGYIIIFYRIIFFL
jgi:hypothetical protein